MSFPKWARSLQLCSIYNTPVASEGEREPSSRKRLNILPFYIPDFSGDKNGENRAAHFSTLFFHMGCADSVVLGLFVCFFSYFSFFPFVHGG